MVMQNVCRFCAGRLDINNPYSSCQGCQWSKGTELREEFTYVRNNVTMHMKVCQRCTHIYEANTQHICINAAQQQVKTRDEEIEYEIQGAVYNSRLLKKMWDEIVDLRSRLDMREIEDDIVPEMKRWEEELGGDLPDL